MNQSKINWLLDTDGKYKKNERGYDAAISLDSFGQATLTVTYTGTPPVALPTTSTWATIKLAKQAFRVYLRDVPVVVSTA